jgi:hypothetical protein
MAEEKSYQPYGEREAPGLGNRAFDALNRYFLPPGPIVSITLIGLILLSAVLYYRAVKAQRFLEPALAISQPWNNIVISLRNIFFDEFGLDTEGVRFGGDVIFVRKAPLLQEVYHGYRSETLSKVGQVFVRAMEDPSISPYVDFILIASRAPITEDRELNKKRRQEVDIMSSAVLDALFRQVPELEDKFAMRFTSSALMAPVRADEDQWFEFHVVLNEQLHIQLLESLQKYVP